MRMTKKQRTSKEEGWMETHTQMHTNTQNYKRAHTHKYAQIRTHVHIILVTVYTYNII